MGEINKENYLQKIAEISKKKTDWNKDFEKPKKKIPTITEWLSIGGIWDKEFNQDVAKISISND